MAPSAISPSQENLPVPTVTKHDGQEEQTAVVQKKQKTPLEMISQGVSLPGIPQHPTFATHRQWQLEKMALAFRVFARKGYTEGMSGHISVRDPENPHSFWTNRTLTSIPHRADSILTSVHSIGKTFRPT